MKSFICLLLCLSLCSCASVKYKTEFKHVGVGATNFEKIEGDIPVYFYTAPEGIVSRDNVIEVQKGYKHKIIGIVDVKHDGWSPGMAVIIPLMIITGGIYVIAYGISCGSAKPDKEKVIELMKDKAKEMGANAIVYASIDDAPYLGVGYAVILDPDLEYE